MSRPMLTTTDNPFNPHTQFDEWNNWDKESGYHTLAYLARVVKTSNELSDADNELAIEQAIDSIIEFNLTGTYTRSYK